MNKKASISIFLIVSILFIAMLAANVSSSSVSIAPKPAYDNNTITCQVTGGCDGNHIIRWYRGDNLFKDSITNGALSVGASATSAGETWTCKAYDYCSQNLIGTDSVIIRAVPTNQPPIINTIMLTPDPVQINGTLNCLVNASDIDGQAVTVSYSWTSSNAGYSLAGITTSMLNLSTISGEAAGDNITCTATPNDGIVNGLPASDTATVTATANNAPNITSIMLTPDPATINEMLTCTVVTADADGNPVTVRYVWTTTGSYSLGSFTGNMLNLSQVSGEAVNDVITCTATPNDGMVNGTSASDSVTLRPNTVPLITPNLPDVNLSENSGFNANITDIWYYVTDAESPDDQLVYTIVSETNIAVVDCSISANRFIDCYVVPNQVGISDVRIRITDPAGAFAEDVFRVNVVSSNSIPTVTLISPVYNQSFAICEDVWFYAIASDLDGVIQNMGWTVDGATYYGNNFSITAASLGVGTHAGSLIVTDNEGATATVPINFTIRAHSDPFVNITSPISYPSPTTIYPFADGQYIGFFAQATATDGCISPTAQYIWRDNGIDILSRDQGFGTAGLPVGIHNITVYFYDGYTGVAYDSMIIEIITNQPPNVTGIPDITMYEDTPYNGLDLDDYASDREDLDVNLTWSVEGNINLTVAIDPLTHVVTLTPRADWNGIEVLTFTACDTEGLCDSDSTIVTVVPVNDAPVVSGMPDITMPEDTTRSISLNEYVTDVDNTDAQMNWTYSGNTNINIIFDALSNVVTFDPADNWFGAETIIFTACDPSLLCDSDDMIVTVTAVNDCPVVSDISNIFMYEDVPYTTNWSLNGNVTDVDGDVITWTYSGNTNMGVSIDGAGFITLTPALNWYGTETIMFNATDGVCSDTDFSMITVQPVNDAPVITDVPDVTMPEDNTYLMDLDDYASDIDNLDSQLRWNVSGNVNITITIDAATHVAIITPILNWNGIETVTFAVCDPAGLCDSDTSTITVTAVNDCPVVSDISNIFMYEDVPYTTNWSLNGNVTDVDGDVITWTYSGNTNIGVSINGAGFITLTNMLDWYGVELITFNASDGLCADSDISVITVQPVNDAPVISDVPDFSMPEDSIRSIDLDDYASDVDNADSQLRWNVSGNVNISITIDPLSNIATFIPIKDWNGYETVTFAVCDPAGLCDSDTAIITVTPVNDCPTLLQIPSVTMYEDTTDTSLDLDNYSIDIDGDILTWSAIGTSNITITIDGANVASISPIQDWNGADIVTFTASDLYCSASDDTVVNVLPVNDAPVITDVPDFTMEEDTIMSVDLDDYAYDIDNTNSELTWNVSGNASIRIVIDPLSNIATFIPAADWNGYETVTFAVCDPDGLCDSDTSTITVTAVNDCPVVSDISNIFMYEDVPYTTTWSLNGNVTDVDGDPITWTYSGNMNVVVSIDPAGFVALSSALDWYGTETVTFNASDEICSDSDDSYITVHPVNDAPVITDVPDLTIEEDRFAVLDLDNYASDVDNANINLTWSVSGNVNVTIMIDNLTNVAVFTPVHDWVGQETVNFTVCDPDGLCDSDEMTITVTPVNDCPVLSDIPGVMMDEDTTDTSLDLDNYVTDVDNTLAQITWSANGNVNITVTIDGTTHNVTLAPAADWYGAEMITFIANDGACAMSNGSIVTVLPVNDAPVITDVPDVSMPEDSTYFMDLDDYASDIDNLDENLTWTVSGNVNMTIAIDTVSHVAALIPVHDWVGYETVNFTVCDPFGLCDSDLSTITVTSVNDAPIVGDVPGVTFDEDTTFTTPWSLDAYVNDVDNTDAEMTWYYSGNANIGVWIDGLTRTVTFNATQDWNGAEVITFTACDPDMLCAFNMSIVVVSPVNDAPVISDIPDMTIIEDSAVSIDLDDYASDVDNTDAELNWSAINSAHIRVFIDLVSHVATIVPDTNWVGAETINFTVCDPFGLCDSDTTLVSVVEQGDAPIISLLPPVTMFEDTPYTTTWSLDTYVSDIDNTDDELTWTISGNTNINYTINPSGNITFTSTLNWNDAEILNFTVCDPTDLCDSALAPVTVMPVNDAPVVSNIPDVTMIEDSFDNSIDLDDYVMDIDNTNAEIGWTFSGNTNIIVIIDANHVVTLVPLPNWNGTEIINYTACDPDGLCDSDLSTVIVVQQSDVPVVDLPEPFFWMTEDTPRSLDLDDYVTDADTPDSAINWNCVSVGGNITGIAIDSVTHNLTITPLANWFGMDILTCTANDGTNSVSDNMTVIVAPVNDAPWIDPVILDQTMNEDDPAWTLDLSAYENDIEDINSPEPDTLRWSVSGVNTSLFTAVIDLSGNNITFTPVANANGMDMITLTLKDSGNLTAAQNITVTLNSVNDAPILLKQIGNFTAIDEDSNTTYQSLDNFVYDADNDVLIWTAAGSVNTGVYIDPVAHTLRITPVANWNGNENVTFEACDPYGACVSDTSLIVVRPINDAPVVGGIPNVTMSEDTPYTTLWSLNDYVADVDNADANMSWSYTGNVNLTVLIDPVTRVVTFTPFLNWYGQETITFTATDPGSLSDSDASTVTVISVNDAPVANAGIDQPVTTGATVTLNGSLSYDVDGDALTYSWMQVSLPVVPLSSPASAVTTFVAAADGTYEFQLTVSDGTLTDTDNVIITSASIANTAPVADANGPYSGSEGIDVTFDGSSSFDSDAPLDWIIQYLWDFGDGQAGLGVNPTHAYADNGVYPVTLTVMDSRGASSFLNITSVTISNVAPAVAIPDVSFTEDTTLPIDLDDYVTDVAADPITWIYSGNSNVIVNMLTGNIVQFSAAANWYGTETINFTANDGDGGLTSDLVTVTVTAVNDMPVINSMTVTPNPVNMDGLLTCTVSAFDADGTIPTISYVWASSNVGYSLAGFTASTLDLSAVTGETAGDVITCTATPNDGIISGLSASDSSMVTGAVLPACSNGLDDDTDGDTDYPNDPGCADTSDNDETDPVPLPQCGNLADDDGDGFIDYPLDTGCYAASDNNETNIVGNTAPTANAGPDQSVLVSTLVTLTGAASTDDGLNAPLTYTWSQIGGAPVTLSNTAAVSPTFTPTAAGTYTFSLTVFDGQYSSTDTVVITVNTFAQSVDIAFALYDLLGNEITTAAVGQDIYAVLSVDNMKNYSISNVVSVLSMSGFSIIGSSDGGVDSTITAVTIPADGVVQVWWLLDTLTPTGPRTLSVTTEGIVLSRPLTIN